jgi:hypothetical protein
MLNHNKSHGLKRRHWSGSGDLKSGNVKNKMIRTDLRVDSQRLVEDEEGLSSPSKV